MNNKIALRITENWLMESTKLITTKNLFTENLKMIGEIDNLHYDLKWYEIYRNRVMIRFGVLVK